MKLSLKLARRMPDISCVGNGVGRHCRRRGASRRLAEQAAAAKCLHALAEGNAP